MKHRVEKFKLLIRSPFKEERRAQLFEMIWKSYRQNISFYITGILSPGHPSQDDIFQDVMIKIYKNLHHFKPMHSLKPLLYKITRNCCLNFIKLKSQIPHRELEPHHLTTRQTPEQKLLRDDFYQEIDSFVNAMEPREREIFYLRFSEGIRYKAIADITGLNVNTVKSKIRNIKHKLKVHFKGGCR